MRLLAVVLLAGALHASDINAVSYLNDVKYLASESMRGRATGSPEAARAADFIAEAFRTAGLQPFPDGSYFQNYQVTTSAHLGARNSFTYSEGQRHKKLRAGVDFIPLNLSNSGEVKGVLVFAGYGITAPEYQYDDYTGVDVQGKIVLVLRHEPQEFDEKSRFEGKSYTAHAQLFSKAVNAKMHGAAGLILVSDSAAHPSDDDVLEKFGNTAGPGNSGIAFVQMKEQTASDWLRYAGKDLGQIEKAIDGDLRPRSFALPESLRVDVKVDVERVLSTARNVGGYLPGTTDEYVVLGAHYDHLGLGEQFSLAPSLAGTVHPGADDNASGTAGVIELAKHFAAQAKPRRGILFVAFSGEELGLLGSSYYVNHPEFPLARAVAMINLDMIGRVRDGQVYVGGAGTGDTFGTLLREVRPHHPFRPDLSERAGYGSSDHTSFTTKGVPVLFFFSGLHSDYHKPSDTWEKIDAGTSVELLDLIADVMEHLSADPGRPQFVRVAPAEGPHGHVAGAGSKSGYGPDFGSIPDFTELPNGVRFADIRPGSPASKAGLKAGDILTEFDGKAIGNLYDFTYALRAKKPGDEVPVTVLRNGAPIQVKVLLTERK